MNRFSIHHTDKPVHSYRNEISGINGTGISVTSLERTRLTKVGVGWLCAFLSIQCDRSGT